jgi:WD40 repeat protein
MAFSNDGKTLAFIGGNRILRLWDWTGDQPVRQIAGRWLNANAVVFAADGKIVVLAYANGNNLHLLDGTAGKEVRQVALDARTALTILDISPDARTLVATDLYGAVRQWDMDSGKERQAPDALRAPITSVAFPGNADQVVTVTGDGRFQVTHAATGKVVSQFVSDDRNTFQVSAVSPDGKRVAFGNVDRTLRLVDATTGRELHHIKNAGSFITLAFSHDGKTLATAGADHIVTFWDTETGQERGQLVCPEPQYFSHVLWGPDDRTLFLVSTGRMILLCDVVSGKELRRFVPQAAAATPPAPPRPAGIIGSLALSRDGRVLAAGSTEGAIRLWEVASGKERLRLSGNIGAVRGALVFSADGRALASANDAFGRDPAIRLWDLETGTETAALTGHVGSIGSLALSPDGKTLVSGSTDTTALVWDVADRLVKPRPAVQLTADQLEQHWKDLADDDGTKAYRALNTLVAAGAQSVLLLKERVAPVTVTPEKIKQLIADLDSDQFAARRKASEELEHLGELAEDALRQALKGRPSLAVTKQLEALVGRLEKREVSAGECRALRATQVLEEVGTPAAREVLEKLARGTPGARLTREAQATLQRVSARQP